MLRTKRWLPICLLLATLPGCGESPTGRRQLLLLPEDALNAAAAEAFAQEKARAILSASDEINRYIQCVTGRLTQRQQGNWELAIVNDRAQVNAGAMPGGKIIVYTGILRAARTPDQFAAVIGHEIGHVLARHGNERASQALASQTGMRLLLRMYSGGEPKPRDEAVVALLGAGVNVGVLLPFSRAQESEADQIGLQLMAEAGFDPRESIKLWENMAAETRGQQEPPFLSTHPSHGARMAGLRARMRAAMKRYETARSENAAAPVCALAGGASARPPEPAVEPAQSGSHWQWW